MGTFFFFRLNFKLRSFRAFLKVPCGLHRVSVCPCVSWFQEPASQISFNPSNFEVRIHELSLFFSFLFAPFIACSRTQGA